MCSVFGDRFGAVQHIKLGTATPSKCRQQTRWYVELSNAPIRPISNQNGVCVQLENALWGVQRIAEVGLVVSGALAKSGVH